jgi:hypothetical protein
MEFSGATHSITDGQRERNEKIECLMSPRGDTYSHSPGSTEAKVGPTIRLFETHVLQPYRFMFEKLAQRAEGNPTGVYSCVFLFSDRSEIRF